MRVRDLGYQPMRAQQVEPTRHLRGATALLRHALRPNRKQHCLEVPIPEPVDMMFPTQHGAEQLLLRHAEQIQASPPTRARRAGFWTRSRIFPLACGRSTTAKALR